MAYIKKLSSLKEMAAYQVAINLCQSDSFKEVAMCLEKAISDFALCHILYSNGSKKVINWDEAIDEQFKKLTKVLAYSLKDVVYIWITRIALEYSSYSRRMELLFGISRYFLFNNLTRGDWIEDSRLNEIKIAKRFLKDERLTVIQRYRIACVYCLHVSIPELWNELAHKEKESISKNDDPCHSQEKNRFVLLWSYYMDERRHEKVTGQNKYLWSYAAMLAVHYGNKAILMQCWKRLNKHLRKHTLTAMAIASLEKWKLFQARDDWGENLVMDAHHWPNKPPKRIGHFNLPYYYSELLRFFLSKMNERQQLRFFEIAFDNWRKDFNSDYPGLSILGCFTHWPLQDYFLPTMNRLWGITPKKLYGQTLLSLAVMNRAPYDKCSSSGKFYKRESLFYDYGSMLWNLWEITPEVYMQHVFYYKKQESWGFRNIMMDSLLLELLKREPLHDKDITLFKRIFHDVPQEKKLELIHSRTGEAIFSQLMYQEKWSFADWILQECLTDVEIPTFKETLIKTHYEYCFTQLTYNCEKYVENFIDWAFKLDTDKMKIKYEICKYGSYSIEISLSCGKFDEVERIINFCISSEEMKAQFKVDVVKKTCQSLFGNCAWEQMDKALSWGFDAEEKIKDFKKDLFYSEGFNVHYDLVFYQRQWENVEWFYKWFCLSPEEIINIKKKTFFAPNVIEDVHEALLYKAADMIVASLRWCVTDEEMVFTLKEEIERQYFYKKNLTKRKKKAKKQLDYLVNKLLCDFRKEVVRNKTSKEGAFMKDKVQKRSLMIEDESNSPRKRFQGGGA